MIRGPCRHQHDGICNSFPCLIDYYPITTPGRFVVLLVCLLGNLLLALLITVSDQNLRLNEKEKQLAFAINDFHTSNTVANRSAEVITQLLRYRIARKSERLEGNKGKHKLNASHRHLKHTIETFMFARRQVMQADAGNVQHRICSIEKLLAQLETFSKDIVQDVHRLQNSLASNGYLGQGDSEAAITPVRETPADVQELTPVLVIDPIDENKQLPTAEAPFNVDTE